MPLIGILLSLLLAWGLGYLQSRETERREQSSRAYKQSAKTDAQSACVGMQGPTAFECVYERVEASKSSAHDEQDLSAQQRAASAALMSAIIALVTLIVSVVGVWYVRRTLDATLEAVEDTGKATQAMLDANKLARQSALAEFRPWITFYKLNRRLMWVDESHAALSMVSLGFQYINCGRSPVAECRYATDFSVTEPTESPPIFTQSIEGSASVTVGINAVVSSDWLPVSMDDMFKVMQRTKDLWFYSLTVYENPAEPGVELRTELCGKVFYEGNFKEGEIICPQFTLRLMGTQNTMI